MPGNAMYCHACHHQWQRESDAIECPACRSSSTEIITSENDPRQFHNRPAEPIPAASASAESPATAQNSGPAPSNPDQEMSDAPPNEPAAGNTGAHSGNGHHPQFVFLLPPPMVTFVTTVVTDTHIPPPNTYGPRGPPVTAHFSMNFFPPPMHRHQSPPAAPPSTGVNSPPDGAERLPGQQQNATPGNAPHTGARTLPTAPLNLLELLLGPMIGVPANAALGDAVFSQEALDRIISHLREQSGPGGAPPASQAAIDKLEVKELDNNMLGGEAKTRCVICVDEMSVGEKASVLPCSHFFHGECVTPWLKQHNTCPVCRRSIEPEVVRPAKAAEFAHDAHHPHQDEHAPNAQGCS